MVVKCFNIQSGKLCKVPITYNRQNHPQPKVCTHTAEQHIFAVDRNAVLNPAYTHFKTDLPDVAFTTPTAEVSLPTKAQSFASGFAARSNAVDTV
uniref:Uncharacterized protein n=1 Tax=Rhipicephalus zambeziensis TaxID=60191 RepID=A0A224YLN3_9ACAR